MQRAFKFSGILILHTLVALIGTAILENTVWTVFRPQSLSAFLWKEWILSLLCAALVGFLMWRTWRGSAAMWVWLLTGSWFVLRFVLSLPASHGSSVLAGGGLWDQFSGSACDGGIRTVGCRNFFVFTIPFARGVAYSVGALLSSMLTKAKIQSNSEPLS